MKKNFTNKTQSDGFRGGAQQKSARSVRSRRQDNKQRPDGKPREKVWRDRDLGTGRGLHTGAGYGGANMRSDDNLDELVVYGKNAVLETLQSGSEVNKLVVIKDSRDHTIQKIIDICKERRHPIRFAEKEAIDRLTSGLHQGAVLYTAPFKYADVSDILGLAAEKSEAPMVVLLDGITDPHNLGAVIRTAEAAGAHGVIIPKRGVAAVNSLVLKVSSGAAEHIKIARVSNLVNAIKELKKLGLWIVGTSPDAELNYTSYDMRGPVGIVIGSEGEGMSRLVREHCDSTVRIDMYGRTSSLNASVAAGIVIFEALRQRRAGSEN